MKIELEENILYKDIIKIKNSGYKFLHWVMRRIIISEKTHVVETKNKTAYAEYTEKEYVP